MERARDELLERLEALEAEVAALRAEQERPRRKMPPAPMTRRRALRAGGLALAGAAGALASPALTGRAAAANDDPALLGQTNTATLMTAIDGTVDGSPTVRLRNESHGAPLRLLPATDPNVINATVLDQGNLYQTDGFLYFGWGPDAVG